VSAVFIPPARRLVAYKTVPGLRHLTPAQLIELGAHGRACRFRAGELLQEEGAEVSQLHLVVAGTVRVSHPDAEDTLLSIGLVGGLEALTGDPSRFTAVAEEPVTAIAIERATMRAIMAENFALYMAVLADVARRVLEARSVSSRGTVPPPERASPPPPTGDSMVATIAALLSVPELADLPVDVLSALAAHAEREEHPAGATLWRRGDPCRRAVLILRGDILVDGRPRRVRPRLWGIEESLASQSRAQTVEATSAVDTLSIEPRALFDELEDDATAAAAFLEALARIAIRSE
jgi:CRP-like cAMP-binding protein